MTKFLATFLCLALALSQSPAQSAAPPAKEKKTVKDDEKKAQEEKGKEEKDAHTEYKQTILKASLWVKNVTDEGFYKEVTFTHKKTKEEKKLADLPEFDKKMFLLMQLEKLNDQIETVSGEWKTRLENYEKLKEAPPKEDLEGYISQLHFWHKKASAKHKAHAEKLFKDHTDQFSKEEADAYLKKLADYQKKFKLEESK